VKGNPKSELGTLACVLLFALMAASRMLGQEEFTDSREPVIHYHSPAGLADPVTRVQNELEAGKRKLRYEPAHGYLASLLEALKVPVSSQTLVFSKTSSQDEQTCPRTPRAIYFSEDVYVGWVPGCPVIDIAAMDPQRGTVFYTLEQRQDAHPKFTRRFDCLRCHETGRTLQVPGLFVRSTYTGPDGTPLATVREFVSGHNSPLEDRWAGWYVSGTHISARAISAGKPPGPAEGELHLGNLISSNVDCPEKVDLAAGANRTDLRALFDSPRYLSSHSDIVALLVLEHQVRMHTLITRANYETRLALAELHDKPEALADLNSITQESPWPQQRIAQAGEKLLEYMLFRDEAPLKGPVKGTSAFATNFQRGGPGASGERSLRQLDLRTRLFRYPCSYLIDSESFDALPTEMKNYLWRRLDQIFNGRDPTDTYANMPAEDRRAVLKILRRSKPEFESWLRLRENPKAEIRRPLAFTAPGPH
jgi:hypothetical protein